jgi:hypothetical protein
VDEKFEDLCFEDLPEEIFEDNFYLRSLNLYENDYGRGTIEVIDMVKLLRRCQDFYKKKEEFYINEWLNTDFSRIIKKLEAMILSKLIEENDVIHMEYM